MIKERIRAKGTLRLVLTGADGTVRDDRKLQNLVVTTGLTFIASRMASDSASVMTHMALGTGDTEPAIGDTTLGVEVAREALTSASASANVVSYAATFDPGVGTGAITEAGIFNDASSGVMLNRVTFPVVNKQAGDTLSIAWTVSLL